MWYAHWDRTQNLRFDVYSSHVCIEYCVLMLYKCSECLSFCWFLWLAHWDWTQNLRFNLLRIPILPPCLKIWFVYECCFHWCSSFNTVEHLDITSFKICPCIVYMICLWLFWYFNALIGIILPYLVLFDMISFVQSGVRTGDLSVKSQALYLCANLIHAIPGRLSCYHICADVFMVDFSWF